VWVTLPYLLLGMMAKNAGHFQTKEILVLIGALIITVGGMAAYVDAIWLRPDPQSGLAVLAVPLYQLIIVGLVRGYSFC
jgi:predicted permease